MRGNETTCLWAAQREGGGGGGGAAEKNRRKLMCKWFEETKREFLKRKEWTFNWRERIVADGALIRNTTAKTQYAGNNGFPGPRRSLRASPPSRPLHGNRC